MHSDTGTSRRNHLCNSGKRNKRHTLEERCHIRMILQTRIALIRKLFHVKQLGRTRHEHRKCISSLRLWSGTSVVIVVISVIVLQKSDVAHLIQKLLEALCSKLLHLIRIHFAKLAKRVVYTLFHGQTNLCHLLGDDLGKSPVFRVLHLYTTKNVSGYICDFSSKLDDLVAWRLITLVICSPF